MINILKVRDEDGNWIGIPAIVGPRGETGVSIKSIERTAGNGTSGTTDTYTITLTDGSTTVFQVYNGKDGEGAGDMVAAIYDPQGKAQDVFAYVDKAVANKVSQDDLQDATDAALAQAKESGEFDGEDGKNGISCTHQWNGTTLIVTSASGTSEADLKGAKGDPGYTPQKGTDYWTADDRAQMVTDTIAALPDASEGGY